MFPVVEETYHYPVLAVSFEFQPLFFHWNSPWPAWENKALRNPLSLGWECLLRPQSLSKLRPVHTQWLWLQQAVQVVLRDQWVSLVNNLHVGCLPSRLTSGAYSVSSHPLPSPSFTLCYIFCLIILSYVSVKLQKLSTFSQNFICYFLFEHSHHGGELHVWIICFLNYLVFHSIEWKRGWIVVQLFFPCLWFMCVRWN